MPTQIKTWQEAFKAKGLDPKALPDVSMIPKEYQKPVIAQYKLNVVADVLNDGWKPDYTDRNQWKYYPWFEVKADDKSRSGSGLSFYVVDGWSTGTAAGVRLCFKDRKTATYAGKQFIKLYEDLYLMPK